MLNNYKVFVNGKKEIVYATRTRNECLMNFGHMPFVIAEAADTARVEIYSTEKIESVCIRPKSAGIKYEFDGHKITFNAMSKSKLSVEINGRITSSIGIFINEPVEKPKNTTVFFERGFHSPEYTELKDNDVVYLAKGAYVRSKMMLKGKNIKICGNGIISGELIKEERERKYDFLVQCEGCSDCEISDVTLIQSSDWNMRISGCDRMKISDVKIIGYRGNNDGVDVCGSRDVEVKNCFIRTTDDCLTVKAFNTGDVRNIHFHDCILWNNYANPMRVGGIRADKAENLVFENMDIIHDLAGYPLFAVLEGNRAEISNVYVRNIRAEDVRNAHLFDIRMKPNMWASDKKVGSLKNIHFDGIYYNGEDNRMYLPQDSVIAGASEESFVDGVTFENIFVYGRQMTSLEDCRIDVRKFAKNVNFIYDGKKRDVIKTTVSQMDFKLKDDGYYYGKVEITAKNDMPEDISTYIRLDISPDTTHRYDKYKMEKITVPANGEVTKTYDVALRPGKYLIASESNDSIVIPDRKVIELEFVLKDTDYENVKNIKPYEICDMHGNFIASIAMGKTPGGILLYTKILNKDPDNGVPEIKFYTTKRPQYKDGDAYFNSIETAEGRAVPMIYFKSGAKTEPIMRNHSEIEWTLNNAPEYNRIICVSCNTNGVSAKRILNKDIATLEDGNRVTIIKESDTNVDITVDSDTSDNITASTFFIPYSQAEIVVDGTYAFEIEVNPVTIKNEYGFKIFSLCESMSATASTHMYGILN